MIDRLRELEKEGLITLRPNEDGMLLIANYTPTVQYDRLWTPELKACRGLIVFSENHPGRGEIKARPLPKFFNIEEHEPHEIPNEPFEVFEKMDGSLGICYYYGGWKIATRGSFTSEQALKATELLHTKYKHDTKVLVPSVTYLFEIIYPENRIVVDYGDEERLVLLSALSKSGYDYGRVSTWPDLAEKFDGINDIEKIRDSEPENKEGYVLKFESGMRVKVKFEEYVRLHKILTNVTARTIWEYLKDGKDMKELIDNVPDEFYGWLYKTKEKIEDDFMDIRREVSEKYLEIVDNEQVINRKEFAMRIKDYKYSSLLFSLQDGKDISGKIWKIIKPKHETPFKDEA